MTAQRRQKTTSDRILEMHVFSISKEREIALIKKGTLTEIFGG